MKYVSRYHAEKASELYIAYLKSIGFDHIEVTRVMVNSGARIHDKWWGKRYVSLFFRVFVPNSSCGIEELFEWWEEL